MECAILTLAAGVLLAGCEPECSRRVSPRVGALEASAWAASEWISAAASPVADEAARRCWRAADGTAAFWRRVVNMSIDEVTDMEIVLRGEKWANGIRELGVPDAPLLEGVREGAYTRYRLPCVKPWAPAAYSYRSVADTASLAEAQASED